jgi:hypothetical protein
MAQAPQRSADVSSDRRENAVLTIFEPVNGTSVMESEKWITR